MNSAREDQNLAIQRTRCSCCEITFETLQFNQLLKLVLTTTPTYQHKQIRTQKQTTKDKQNQAATYQKKLQYLLYYVYYSIYLNTVQKTGYFERSKVFQSAIIAVKVLNFAKHFQEYGHFQSQSIEFHLHGPVGIIMTPQILFLFIHFLNLSVAYHIYNCSTCIPAILKGQRVSNLDQAFDICFVMKYFDLEKMLLSIYILH